MRRLIPSTQTLIAFEAAARHQSFSRAAEELHCTQSAVNRQIVALEEALCVPLFHRAKRRVTLTDAGRDYWKKIRHHLAALEHDSLELMSRQGRQGSLELAVLPTFASAWLIPRLPDFYRCNPDISLNLAVRNRPFLFEETSFDAAIHFGDPVWSGAECEVLMGEEMVPVYSPLLVGDAPCDFDAHPEYLARFTLLHVSSRPDAWFTWFKQQGVELPQAMLGPRMELFSMLIQAAKAQLGIALVPYRFVQDEVQSGALMMLASRKESRGRRGNNKYSDNTKSRVVQEGEKGYYLVYPQEKAQSVTLNAFRAWIRYQAAMEG